MAQAKEQHPLWEESEAWKTINRTPEGQKAIQALVKKFGFTTQTLWDSDPGKMARNEGSRMVCVHIGRMLSMEIDDAADTTAKHSED